MNTLILTSPCIILVICAIIFDGNKKTYTACMISNILLGLLFILLPIFLMIIENNTLQLLLQESENIHAADASISKKEIVQMKIDVVFMAIASVLNALLVLLSTSILISKKRR